MKITMDHVTEFYKILVEWGSAFKVDDDYKILFASDDKPVTVESGGDTRDIMVLHGNMKRGNTTFFNPLVETMGHSAEKKWFMASRNDIIGYIVQGCLVKMIELSVAEPEGDKPSYEALEIAQAHIGKADVKMLDELDKLPLKKLVRVMYSKARRTAQLQTDIFNDDYMASLKWRKKTIKMVRAMFSELLASETPHKDFKYVAKELNMPRIECIVNIMAMFGNAIGESAKVLLDVDLYPVELDAHVGNIKEYRTKCGWAVASSVMSDKKEHADKRSSKGTVTIGSRGNPLQGGVSASLLGDPLRSTRSYGAAAVQEMNTPQLVGQGGRYGAAGGGVRIGAAPARFGTTRIGAPPSPATLTGSGPTRVGDRFTSIPLPR